MAAGKLRHNVVLLNVSSEKVVAETVPHLYDFGCAEFS